ncbi:hypothetical protein BLA14095_03723 [Burkholderia lata]|uniref:hypothetical protein n=1 Tax=Burkholderia lata (strain ATCC 17760 / DSM 23089 / LMG 22485 / NCIMB 9086 / R18194 / 383) TaxID=482957 RepID=UPI0014544023|nr:hypothetical protein [Burkholderia lata]VWB80639.1 hypothetical protein BLA14095_03723 [Burkholderia lata]
MSEIPNLIGALIVDTLTAASSSIASFGGAALSSALSAVMERRQAAAREILLDEIRHGGASPTTDDIDESVSILYRYWRAAQEGTGRLNLRLLAAVYAGQVRDKAIVADDFLYYADLLASLRRDEVILLGTFLRHSTAPDDTPRIGHEPLHLTRTELVPNVFVAPEDFKAALGALQRTGLISADAVGGAVGGGSSMVYQVTNLLRQLNRLAEIEQVVSRDHAA